MPRDVAGMLWELAPAGRAPTRASRRSSAACPPRRTAPDAVTASSSSSRARSVSANIFRCRCGSPTSSARSVCRPSSISPIVSTPRRRRLTKLSQAHRSGERVDARRQRVDRSRPGSPTPSSRASATGCRSPSGRHGGRSRRPGAADRRRRPRRRPARSRKPRRQMGDVVVRSGQAAVRSPPTSPTG